MDLGNRLTQQRKKYGYTQLQLSAELNISQQVISNYERNVTMPTIEFLKDVADLYRISIDELVGHQVTFKECNSIEKKILSIIENMDDTKKELSLRLVNEIAQHRGQIYDK